MSRLGIMFTVFFLTFTCAAKPQTGAWSATGSLAVPRAYHKTVMLNNGKILLSGGARYITGIGDVYLPSCEIYDPANGTWSLTDSLKTRRYFHTMTLLQNGCVLITGGAYASGNRFYHLNSCELYNPSTARWTVVSQMNYSRAGHTATLLSDGRVFVTGGLYFDGTNDIYLKSCELYNPNTDQWVLTDSMSIPRKDHSATLLPGGNVLVVSGHYAITYPNITYLKTCEVFNPTSQSWSIADSLSIPQSGHSSAVLPDGRLLIAGGYYSIKTCQLFDPATMTWSVTGPLNVGRDRHSVTLLPNGKILAAGLQATNYKCELYNSTTGTWALSDSLPYDLSAHSAILLNNGKVLLSGGYSYTGGGYLSNCLLFDYSLATAVGQIRETQSAEHSLAVYPNPFNSSIAIRYSVGSPSNVRIQIFDILGRLVETPVNQSESYGEHIVFWHGNSVPSGPASSGIYFCTMHVNGVLLGSARMVMLR